MAGGTKSGLEAELGLEAETRRLLILLRLLLMTSSGAPRIMPRILLFLVQLYYLARYGRVHGRTLYYTSGWGPRILNLVLNF